MDQSNSSLLARWFTYCYGSAQHYKPLLQFEIDQWLPRHINLEFLWTWNTLNVRYHRLHTFGKCSYHGLSSDRSAIYKRIIAIMKSKSVSADLVLHTFPSSPYILSISCTSLLYPWPWPCIRCLNCICLRYWILLCSSAAALSIALISDYKSLRGKIVYNYIASTYISTIRGELTSGT